MDTVQNSNLSQNAHKFTTT